MARIKKTMLLIVRFIFFSYVIFAGFAATMYALDDTSAAGQVLLLPAVDEKTQKFGYINKNGEWVITPQFDYAWEFYENSAVVNTEDGMGIIDESGHWTCFPQNDWSITPTLSEGLFSITNVIDLKQGFIDRYGNWAIQPVFENAFHFSEGLVAAYNGEKWGFSDRSGNWMIAPQYSHVENFSEGLASVSFEDKAGFIDKNGQFVIPPIYEVARTFHGGKAAVRTANGWGIINKLGNWVIWPQSSISDIQIPEHSELEGFCVRIGDKFGYMDYSGKWVIAAKFDNWIEFSEGVASTGYGLYYGRPANGYIDAEGNWVIFPKFAIANNFENGIAYVAVVGPGLFGAHEGYIDHSGNWIFQWES